MNIPMRYGQNLGVVGDAGGYLLDKWNAALTKYLDARDKFMSVYTDNAIFSSLPPDVQASLDRDWTITQNLEGIIRKVGEAINGVAGTSWEEIGNMLTQVIPGLPLPMFGMGSVSRQRVQRSLGFVQLQIGAVGVAILGAVVLALGATTALLLKDSEIVQVFKAAIQAGATPSQAADAANKALALKQLEKYLSYVPWVLGAVAVLYMFKKKG